MKQETKDMKTIIEKELYEQIECLNQDFKHYLSELNQDNSGITVGEAISNADIDSIEFNIGYEQGYIHALKNILRKCN